MYYFFVGQELSGCKGIQVPSFFKISKLPQQSKLFCAGGAAGLYGHGNPKDTELALNVSSL
jgi:hypothetical protein